MRINVKIKITSLLNGLEIVAKFESYANVKVKIINVSNFV